MILTKRLIAFTALLILSFNTYASEPDWSAYADVLKSVSQGTKNNVKLALVDYQALKENGKLEAAYRQLSSFPVKNLSSKEEELAFYINTYNILALKMVVDHWPLDSIKDAGSLLSPVWGKPAGSINGKTVSLDDIENKILRPMGEPRIHFAIVCASVSCPDLRNTPYTASTLNAQLDKQVQKFLTNAIKGSELAMKASGFPKYLTGSGRILSLQVVLRHSFAATGLIYRNCCSRKILTTIGT